MRGTALPVSNRGATAKYGKNRRFTQFLASGGYGECLLTLHPFFHRILRVQAVRFSGMVAALQLDLNQITRARLAASHCPSRNLET